MLDWNERKIIQNDEPIEASRPLLIFNHNPKAGGGSILEVLRGFKSRQIDCHFVAAKAEARGSACKAKAWEEAFEGDGGVDTAFLHFREFARTTHFDRVHGFVIGSIREPCSQYLSLWSWGSLGNGAFRNSMVTDPDLYGVSKPYFNTTSDKKRFMQWMKHPLVDGTVGDRVKESYGDSVLDTVDCWVFVEDFQDSLLRCLRAYEDQGGFVDWEAPTVLALLEGRDKTEEINHNYAKKNDPLGDPRSSHHGKCEDMFDEATAKHVEENTEPFVYELFGYEGCCRPGTNFFPRNDNKSSIHFESVDNLPRGNRQNDTFIASSNSDVSNSENGWQSSPHSIMQSYDDHTIDTVIAVATIAAILLLTICRFLRI